MSTDTRYQVVERLAASPPVLAFRAVHPARPGQFRIQVLAGLPGDVQAAFLRDVETLALIQHPHLLPLEETVALPDGTPGCVHRWPDGTNLEDHLTAGQPLTREQGLAVIMALADALTAAHARGIGHGAVRAAAVQLSTADAPAGTGPWLLGFGDRHLAPRSAEGSVDRRADGASELGSDLGALAALADRLLTPTGLVDTASDRAFFVGPEVEGVLARARTDATAFPTPMAFALALARACECAPPAAAKAAPRSAGRRLWLGVATMSAAAAAVIALGLPLLPRSAESPAPPAPTTIAAVEIRPAELPPASPSPAPASPSPAPASPSPPPPPTSSPPVASPPASASTPPAASPPASPSPRPRRVAGRRPDAVRRGLVWSPRQQSLIQVDDQGAPVGASANSSP